MKEYLWQVRDVGRLVVRDSAFLSLPIGAILIKSADQVFSIGSKVPTRFFPSLQKCRLSILHLFKSAQHRTHQKWAGKILFISSSN